MVLSTIIKPLQENKREKEKKKKQNWLQLIKVIPIHPININAKDD